MGLNRDSYLTIKDILLSDYETTIKGEDLIPAGLHFTGKPMSAAILRIENEKVR
jgi:hypothetical protein